MHLKLSKGFNIIEVIVATSILAVSLVMIYLVFARTIYFFPYIRSSFEAAYLAQEGLEIVRNVRDSNWVEGREWDHNLTTCSYGCEADYKNNDFTSYEGRFLKRDNYNNNLYNYEEGDLSVYQREIIIKENNNIIVVNVIVRWKIRDDFYEIDVENHLYNWL